jgi:hypothetical protein
MKKGDDPLRIVARREKRDAKFMAGCGALMDQS